MLDVRVPASSPVPQAEFPARIRRGIAVTFVASLLATPLSYFTQVSLARLSPEAVGFFGAVLLVASCASTFLYVGGSSVIINYLPATPAGQRTTFLVSYAVLVCTCACLIILAVLGVPTLLPLILERSVGDLLLVLWPLIALLAVFQELVMGMLKGLMALAAAQLTLRIGTAGYFLALGALPWLAPAWFTVHVQALVTAAYVVTTVLSILIGLALLRRHLNGGPAKFSWHWPSGFWIFMALTQLSSTVNFLNTRLDQLLLLSFGGLPDLGIYVVLCSLAGVMALVSGFLLDAVFPALANVVATADSKAVQGLYRQAARINQPLVTALTLALLAGHHYALALYGPSYRRYAPTLIVLTALLGLNSLGTLSAYVLIAYRRSFRLLACQLLQISCFFLLFASMAALDLLLRLALAQGVAILLASLVTMRMVPRDVRPRTPREFWASASVIIPTATIALFVPFPLIGGVALFLTSLTLFCLLGGYSFAELRGLVTTLSVSSLVKP